MNQPRTYYTDDITLMPTNAVWQRVRRGSLIMGVPWFLYFLLRKSLRWRYAANYAVARPVELPKVSRDAVPNDVVDKLTPIIDTCLEPGFSVFSWTCPEHIGKKQTFSAVMLHETGLVAAIAIWFRVTLGDQVQERVVFGCHSFDQGGTQLSTGAVGDDDWIPEMVPQNLQMLRLAETASVSETIEAHFDRVASRSDLVEFDSESLERELLATSQALFDHGIERGLYVPITDAEFERLSKISGDVAADLV